MANINKISSSLSIAATVLLQACSSADSNTGTAPVAEANTKAPELIGTWQSQCERLSFSSTSTSASGNAVQTGTATIERAVFSQNGNVELSREDFSSIDCNANTSSGLRKFNAVYFIGNTTKANDGSDATEIRYSTSSSTTYTIFQTTNGITLNLGELSTSSAGRDGTSSETRLDGLGIDQDKK